jgi:hypothetical protein
MMALYGTRLLAAGLAVLAVTGCASAPYEGKYAWADGWRRGEVVFVQTAAEMKRPRFYTCVRDASAEQLTTTKFAVVEYREMSRTHRYAIPLRFGDKAAVGELVYVKVDECGAPLIHRVPASRAG